MMEALENKNPVHELMLAIVSRVADDLKSGNEKKRRNAKRWFTTNRKKKYIFDYACIAETLDLPSGRDTVDLIIKKESSKEFSDVLDEDVR